MRLEQLAGSHLVCGHFFASNCNIKSAVNYMNFNSTLCYQSTFALLMFLVVIFAKFCLQSHVPFIVE